MPALHTEKMRTEVHSVVKAHARDLENEISASWSSRHEDPSALKKLGDGFVASEDLSAKFSAYPDIYFGVFLSKMSQRIEDDIEIMTEQARGLFSVRRTRPNTTCVILFDG